MAQIVFAAGAPHAPAIVGLFDKAPDESRKVVTDTYAAITNELRAAKPDVVIAFANDHLSNSRITFYPDFLIGTAAEHTGPHEWFQEWIGCRNYSTKGNPAVAKSLFAGHDAARHAHDSARGKPQIRRQHLGAGHDDQSRQDRHHAGAGAAELHRAALPRCRAMLRGRPCAA